MQKCVKYCSDFCAKMKYIKGAMADSRCQIHQHAKTCSVLKRVNVLNLTISFNVELNNHEGTVNLYVWLVLPVHQWRHNSEFRILKCPQYTEHLGLSSAPI